MSASTSAFREDGEEDADDAVAVERRSRRTRRGSELLLVLDAMAEWWQRVDSGDWRVRALGGVCVGIRRFIGG
jgi:hypothetical protein